MLTAIPALLVLTQAPALPLKAGVVLTRSSQIRPGEYLLPSKNEAPVLQIKGDNLVIDFQGAILRGSPTTVDPDQRPGVGISIEGKNVTIKNLKLHGYKVGLIARNSPGLKILDSDLSYNWKPRLKSTPEKEDLGDWMSYHRNEKDEWLRYGAAAYLRGCDGFEIRNVTAVGASNGVLLMESNKGLLWNSNLSFNSSLGVGMYQSSDNRIMHNRIDWNVRGFSFGVYNRGQDSAGILIYEQSHRNVFAYNSVTHSGDGFFLWAGQTTMDTGKGGCNDNLLIRNDFSHAPTNGIEATFSRNVFADNLLLECWHGIWGGYSYESKTVGNVFGYNGQAVAWEHGQDNLFAMNRFTGDSQGIVLWANPTQDPNWGYPKNRDTKSRDIRIEGNQFEDVALDSLNLRRTTGVKFLENEVFGGRRAIVLGEEAPLPEIKGNTFKTWLAEGTSVIAANNEPVEVPDGNRASRDGAPETAWMSPGGGISNVNIDPRAYHRKFEPLVQRWLATSAFMPSLLMEHGIKTPDTLKGGIDPFLDPSQKRGWRYILVDEWGPYDFQRPILQPRGTTENGRLRFEILGPEGSWKLSGIKGGVWQGPTSGQMGSIVTVAPQTGKGADMRISLVYTGQATVDVRGIKSPAGKPVRFGYSKFFAPIAWTVDFYPWTQRDNPSNAQSIPEPTALKAALQGTSLKQLKLDKLDFASGGSFYPGGPSDQFATVAKGDLEIAPGDYVLDVTTDDGIRVYVDGKLVIDQWKYQGPTGYQAKLKLGGKHKILVEHFEINGYSALKVELKRG